MRRLAPFLILILAAVAPAALSHTGDHLWPPTNHSPSVRGAYWTPMEPARDQEINVTVQLQPDVEANRTLLRICRVEAYACRNPIEMTPTPSDFAPNLYGAIVPWEPQFYEDVTTVGIAVLVRHANGTEEESPAENWPDTPAGLPEGAGRYYFYSLPPPVPDVPAPTVIVVLAAIAASALALRRRS